MISCICGAQSLNPFGNHIQGRHKLCPCREAISHYTIHTKLWFLSCTYTLNSDYHLSSGFQKARECVFKMLITILEN